MKISNNFSEDFEKSIINKSFRELDHSELKALDAEGISEQEYNNIQQMLKAMAGIEEEKISPSAALRNKLMDEFVKPQNNKGRVFSLQTWLISGLSAAALITLVFFLFKPELDPGRNSPELSQQITKENNLNNEGNSENYTLQNKLDETSGTDQQPTQIQEEKKLADEINIAQDLATKEEFYHPPAEDDVSTSDVNESAIKLVKSENNSFSEGAPAATGESESLNPESLTSSRSSLASEARTKTNSDKKAPFIENSESMQNYDNLFSSIVTVY